MRMESRNRGQENQHCEWQRDSAYRISRARIVFDRRIGAPLDANASPKAGRLPIIPASESGDTG